MHWQILHSLQTKKQSDRRKEIIRFLFENRGLKTKKVQQEFLDPPDPYKLTLKQTGISPLQIKKAIVRIKKAVRKQEKVIVYGDYDTDGVCATAIMWEALNKLGAKVMPFVPKREEGYGLKVDRIEQFAREGVRLIVTVDQGIVQGKQITRAKKLGVEVVVTDHHQPGEKRPPALAIVHSTELAGVGVAWFLARELGTEPDLDLVAIGTVTDLSPLKGPNRSIVKFGLEGLARTKRKGLRALFDFAGIEREEIGTYEVGFIIGPRLNAAGRMDDPMDSLRLICTKDENRAIGLAQKIDQKNRERQQLMEQTTIHARNLWLRQDGKSALIFVYDQSYEYGVTGLAAGKLKEEFYRPAVVLAPRKDHWVASARSIEEFSIVEAIRQLEDIIEDHGGHHLAAGFSIKTERLAQAQKRLTEIAEKAIGKKELTPTLTVDAEIDLTDLDFGLYQEISQFAPFGIGNSQPVFAVKGAKPVEVKTMGKSNKHLKLIITNSHSSVTHRAIGFGMGDLSSKLEPGKSIDIAFNLIVNQWNGEKELQLKLKDIKI